MLICLDYDGTYTEDPYLWDALIAKAQSRGHTVVVATMRYPQEESWELKDLRSGFDIQIIYTSRKAKRQFVIDTLQQEPDVWIDDRPDFLFTDAV